ncbi:MAG: acyl-CoA dehydrogenase family protein [Coxiellaceae bacterium]|nr:acyl-CoA dehydrogenase family protein [Coxiellaceae bacterium]
MPIPFGCDFLLTDEMKQLKASASAFAEKEIAPLARHIDETNQFPRELWPKLGKAGFLGATISKEYGGTKSGYLAQMIIMEAIGRASSSLCLAYAAHANLCANQIDRFGTPEQKALYLPKLMSGEWLGSLAMSEKTAGSDVLSMQLHAEEKEDHYVLNGHKMWITNGTTADVLVVYAKTNPESGAHGMTTFIVEKNFPGFKALPKLNKLGIRGCDTSELNFNNCIVPKKNILGGLNQGLKILMSGLDIERAVITAAPVGLMHACLDLMIPYVKTRQQFKKRIGDFQFIQHKMSNAHMKFQISQNYLYTLGMMCDQHIIRPEQAAGAYLFAAESATEIALDTIQCLGGIGYLNDSDAGRLLRDAKLYEIGAGTCEVRRLVIARELLKD